SNTLFTHPAVVGDNTQQWLGWHIAGTPTGAKDITTIECNQPLANECEISITDNKGSTVHNMPVNFTEKSVTISTEKLSSGLYFVRITSPTGILFVHKLNVVQ
ncbi:MAG: T9SS type A sorting domain-containing protein, partial [Chitinophagales bacterium]|nr:T9SS type A sorting domain-containing protein [Chitinophagales bacterium]